MTWIKFSLFILVWICCLQNLHATDSIPSTSKTLTWLGIGAGATYTTAMVGLNQLWYAENDRTSFHFFNDNAEWKQVDKLGHFYSAFHIAHGTSKVLESLNVKEQRANLIGALAGFGVLLPIEIFDGHSKAYGASVGDLVANAAGAGFFLIQAKLWDEPRIYPKFSFHQTRFAERRPNILGNGLSEEILKDYNGQTHWLSVDVDKFVAFPRWLNIAVGYGAENMIYARDYQNLNAGLPSAFRQVYLSFDWDLTSIRTNSRIVRTLIFIVNMIKLPAPALEFRKSGIRAHAFYF